jgi:D-aspartate ligase
MNKQHPVVVLGLFETGLGVARSLGQLGIKVYGVDTRKDCGYYSRFVRPRLMPSPIEQEAEFIDSLVQFGKGQIHKPVMIIASDDYVLAVSRSRVLLDKYFLFNMPDATTVLNIHDKYRQYQIVKDAGIPVPVTHSVTSLDDLAALDGKIQYPVLVKGRDVLLWRKHVSKSIKGFALHNMSQLNTRLQELLSSKTPCLVQEIIPGDDSHHYKFSGYSTRDGKLLLGFTSQKLRQNPVHYGVGSLMQSVEYPDLMVMGKLLFSRLGYSGVGSAEFKLDKRDGKLKFIELNQRYWQQNSLATTCGMNFPLTQYLDLTNQNPPVICEFRKGVKWINWYLDTESFLKYRAEGVLDYRGWRTSHKGEKVCSTFTWKDPIPALYGIGFGKKLLKIPAYISRHIRAKQACPDSDTPVAPALHD